MANNGNNGMVSVSAAELAMLRAAKERLDAKSVLTCKVAPKGGVSVSGINAGFPTTFYAEQWERLASFMPTILEFVKANDHLLEHKADTAAVKATKLAARTAAGIKTPAEAEAAYAARQASR